MDDTLKLIIAVVAGGGGTFLLSLLSYIPYIKKIRLNVFKLITGINKFYKLHMKDPKLKKDFSFFIFKPADELLESIADLMQQWNLKEPAKKLRDLI